MKSQLSRNESVSRPNFYYSFIGAESPYRHLDFSLLIPSQLPTPSNLEKWRSSLESIPKHQLLPYLGPSNSVRHGRRRLVPVAGDHHGRPYQVWSLTQLCSIFFLYKANDLSGRLINDPHRGGLCSILMYLEGLFELTRHPSRALD